MLQRPPLKLGAWFTGSILNPGPTSQCFAQPAHIAWPCWFDQDQISTLLTSRCRQGYGSIPCHISPGMLVARIGEAAWTPYSRELSSSRDSDSSTLTWGEGHPAEPLQGYAGSCPNVMTFQGVSLPEQARPSSWSLWNPQSLNFRRPMQAPSQCSGGL